MWFKVLLIALMTGCTPVYGLLVEGTKAETGGWARLVAGRRDRGRGGCRQTRVNQGFREPQTDPETRPDR